MKGRYRCLQGGARSYQHSYTGISAPLLHTMTVPLLHPPPHPNHTDKHLPHPVTRTHSKTNPTLSLSLTQHTHTQYPTPTCSSAQAVSSRPPLGGEEFRGYHIGGGERPARGEEKCQCEHHYPSCSFAPPVAVFEM
jgi:hypothetical protein